MTYFALEPPTRWRAGWTGEGPTQREFYFDCADCDAKEPPIAGVLSTDGTYSGMAVLTDGRFPRLAMFCAPCFARRVAAAMPSFAGDGI